MFPQTIEEAQDALVRYARRHGEVRSAYQRLAPRSTWTPEFLRRLGEALQDYERRTEGDPLRDVVGDVAGWSEVTL